MSEAFSLYGKKNKKQFIIIALCAALAVCTVGYLIIRSFAAEHSIPQQTQLLPASEASGAVASRAYPGVFWWHRDGGADKTDRPRNALYAVKFENGKLVEVRNDTYDKFSPFNKVEGLAKTQAQWEDIAIDDKNNIYIGDIGKDGKCSPTIYRVSEPNPYDDKSVTIAATYKVDWPTDCPNAETMTWLDGNLYIFMKLDKGNTPVYRVTLPAGNSGSAKLTKVVDFPSRTNVSVASISDDHKLLALAGHPATWIYKASNANLRGDDLLKDFAKNKAAFTATFPDSPVDLFGNKNANVEGGAFARNSHDVVYFSEDSRVFYANAAQYGDDTSISTPSVPAGGSTGSTGGTTGGSTSGGATSGSTGSTTGGSTGGSTGSTAGCAIASNLVNPCRPWLGAAANKYDTGSDYAAQVKAHEKLIGRQVDFAHTYYGLSKDQAVTSKTINKTDKAMYDRASTYLFVNWKPVRKWKDADGSNKTANEAFAKMAKSIKGLGDKKIMLTLNHEAENDVSGGTEGCDNFKPASGAASGTPAEFRAMWTNMHKIFKEQGATNVVWVADYMNYETWDCVIDDLWPGNENIDWVLFNAYAFGNQTAKERITRFQNILIKLEKANPSKYGFSSKPWGIAEWNTHNMPKDKAYQYYDDMKDIANGKVAGINLKAFFVFDSIGPDGNNNRIQDVWIGEGSGHDAKYAKDQKKIDHYAALVDSPAFKDGAVVNPGTGNGGSTGGTTGGSTGGNTGGTTTAPKDKAPPSVPSALTSTAKTESTVNLKWTGSTDNVAVAGYNVYRNGTKVATSTQTTYVAAGLAANTSYSFMVSAYDAAGNVSAQTSAYTVTTVKSQDITAPVAPKNVVAKATAATSATLSWDASTDNVAVTGYVVQRNGQTVVQLNAATRTYSDTGLLPLTSYSYAVRAVDAAGNTSSLSQASSVTTPVSSDTQAPAKPTNLAAVVVGNQVNLSWTASTDNVAVKEYTIYRDDVQIAKSTTRSYGDGTATKNKAYKYTVAASDAAGNISAKSNVATATISTQTTTPRLTGLSATYFANTDLSGIGVTRNDPKVNFDWKSSSPIKGIPADKFSARWTGRILIPEAGTYTFYTQADDGVRLYLDGSLAIDNWAAHSVKENSKSLVLQKGQYVGIKMEYYEDKGLASAKLLWKGPSITKQAIPTAQLVTSSYGLNGAYFSDKTLTKQVASRNDGPLDYAWTTAPIKGAPAEGFSVRWTGQVYASEAGDYTFFTKTNGGVRLWVDGKQLIDNWKDQGITENSGTVKLTGGSKYNITFEYYDNTGYGLAQLQWDTPTKDKAVIPQGVLYDR